MGRCRLNGSDGQQGEDRSGVDPVMRCAAFFVSPVSLGRRNEIAAAVWAPGVDVPRFTRPDNADPHPYLDRPLGPRLPRSDSMRRNPHTEPRVSTALPSSPPCDRVR